MYQKFTGEGLSHNGTRPNVTVFIKTYFGCTLFTKHRARYTYYEECATKGTKVRHSKVVRVLTGNLCTNHNLCCFLPCLLKGYALAVEELISTAAKVNNCYQDQHR